jgi:long-chain fatty acid transport protein
MRKGIFLVFLLFLVSEARGSGFYVKPLNGGEGAPTQGDAGSVFFNPAGMGLVNHFEGLIDFSLIVRKIEYSRGITYNYDEDKKRWVGIETSEEKKGNLLNAIPFPYLGFIIPYKKARFGIGFYSPFGGSSKWDENGAQAYQSKEGNITTFFSTAGFAYEVFKNLYLGANFSYVRSVISSKKLYNLTKVTGGYPEDPFMDAELELVNFAGNSWNLGVGILYAYNSSLITGFSYTSPVNIENHGVIRITPIGKTARTLMSENIAEAEGQLKATYPQTYKFSVDYYPFRKLRLRGYFEFINWKQFDGFHFKFPQKTSPFIPEQMHEEQRFKDAFALSLSSKWWWKENIAFLGTLGFDRNAIDEATVGADLYDSDKILFTLGAEFGLGKGFHMRAATQQVFFITRNVKNSTRWPSANGKYKSWVGFFNINLKWMI